jgi:tetratricopeptide (TPR) repeat protein
MRTFDPIPIPEQFWSERRILATLRERDIGALFCEISSTFGASQMRIAMAVGMEQNQVCRIMNGNGRVRHFDIFERIAEMLQMPDRARLALGLAPVNSAAVSRSTPFGTAAEGELLHMPSDEDGEEDSVDRREMFGFGGRAVAGALFSRLWAEPGRLFDALDTGSVGPDHLRCLQGAAADLGVRAVRMPPAQLLEETLALFQEARHLAAKKQPLSVQREVVRCASMFGTVMGELLFNLGHFPLARSWYEAAMRAALEANDQNLADCALAGTTYLLTYGHDPHGVIENVTPRLDRATSSSPVLAWLWAFKSKAHARLGEAGEFENAIDRARQSFETSPRERIHPGIFSFEAPKLRFYEARGRVDLGQGEEASLAAGEALALYDMGETTEPALARLELASARAVQGEPVEACRIATGTVTDARTYLSVSVVQRAYEFDTLLDETRDDAVREWHDALASLRPPDPTLALVAPSPSALD